MIQRVYLTKSLLEPDSEPFAHIFPCSSSEEEMMQSDLEKSLNESVEKVLPSQDTEIESRER